MCTAQCPYTQRSFLSTIDYLDSAIGVQDAESIEEASVRLAADRQEDNVSGNLRTVREHVAGVALPRRLLAEDHLRRGY